MTGHIAVLSNPSAGRGRGAREALVAVSVLRSAGVEVRHHAGRSAADTSRLARAALADAPQALVVVGGDGTLSGILDGVVGQDVPVVLVPAGTGNDLARALQVPLHDPGAAALLALSGRRRPIDVGEVRTGTASRLFLTVAALGFDARVSRRTDSLRWPRGALRYHLALLLEVVRLQPLRYTMSVDGEPPRPAPGTLLAVGNTASYGGGMPICAGAEPDDGMLDIVHVRPLGRLRLLRLLPRLLSGTHLSLGAVTHRRARTVSVSAPRLVVYADGEPVADRECTIGVRAAALTVMVPARAELADDEAPHPDV